MQEAEEGQRLLIFQLPSILPSSLQSQSQSQSHRDAPTSNSTHDNTKSNGDVEMGDAEDRDPEGSSEGSLGIPSTHALSQLPRGNVGKLRVYDDGTLSLDLGDVKLEVRLHVRTKTRPLLSIRELLFRCMQT